MFCISFFPRPWTIWSQILKDVRTVLLHSRINVFFGLLQYRFILLLIPCPHQLRNNQKQTASQFFGHTLPTESVTRPVVTINITYRFLTRCYDFKYLHGFHCIEMYSDYTEFTQLCNFYYACLIQFGGILQIICYICCFHLPTTSDLRYLMSRSCLFIDCNGGTFEVDLEDIKACKADPLGQIIITSPLKRWLLSSVECCMRTISLLFIRTVLITC